MYQRIEPMMLPDSWFGGAVPDPAETHHFSFTGSGREYFKIWMVNLFLSIITLGIYSAWAKVRRIQYFDRNTQLAGAVFDFDGNPAAIFRGRVLAVLLLAAYHYAFGFSLAFGIVVIVALLASLPFLMRGALRFRLRNTRYRGLRFGFSGTPGDAYMAYLPPLLMFLLPAVLAALDPRRTSVAALPVLYLGWPLMYGAMKRYQHRNLQYGALGSSFDVSKRTFYIPYLKAIGIGLLASVVVMAILAAIAVIAKMLGANYKGENAVWLPFVMGLFMAYIAYLLTGPYLQVRIGNLTWSATTLPGMTISSHLKARGFLKLQLVNAVLTLLTLGLYRPFAVVRTYRYRLAHTTVTTEGSFEHALAGVETTGSASADGVADFLGVDLSW